MSKVRELLNRMSHNETFEESMAGYSYYTEFAGILTLDLPDDKLNRRDDLYSLIARSDKKVSFEKIGLLDTVWAVKCELVATKDEAIETILDFLKDIVADCNIKKISIALSLSLSYLNRKPSISNMTDIEMDYSLYEDGTCLIEEHLEPVYPIVAKWNMISHEWDYKDFF